MFLNNILAVAIDAISKIVNEVDPGWLSGAMEWLFKFCGNIGLGIIVFTLIIKLITLPFDIYSRISTKKNSVMMEKIRPELEKLQRQYANNKEQYQLKLQDLYKKNGYSPFSACLPTILNLAFFIIVIGQFSTYSNYSNMQVFVEMGKSYNTAVERYDETNGTEYIEENIPAFIYHEDTDTFEIIYEKAENGEFILDENGNKKAVKKSYLNVENFLKTDYFKEKLKDFGFTYTVKNPDNIEEAKGIQVLAEFGTLEDSKKIELVYNEMQKGAKGAVGEGYKEGYITKKEDGTYIIEDAFKGEEKEKVALRNQVANKILNYYSNTFVHDVIKLEGRNAAAQTFRDTDLRFLWVKNIWSQDLPWEHPIKQTFEQYGFVRNTGCCAGCDRDNAIKTLGGGAETYAELTGGLTKEKNEPNGYLILVILSIGTMLISQLIMQKQNKTQMELSSVDGENGTAAMSQKMMTWMMPIMFGVFSFMYTASFSIYIIVSSIFSLGSTLLINLMVEKRFEKLARIEAENEELRRTGRINEIKDKNKKKNKKKGK